MYWNPGYYIFSLAQEIKIPTRNPCNFVANYLGILVKNYSYAIYIYVLSCCYIFLIFIYQYYINLSMVKSLIWYNDIPYVYCELYNSTLISHICGHCWGWQGKCIMSMHMGQYDMNNIAGKYDIGYTGTWLTGCCCWQWISERVINYTVLRGNSDWQKTT